MFIIPAISLLLTPFSPQKCNKQGRITKNGQEKLIFTRKAKQKLLTVK
jgi:hypothetical protein